MKDKVLEPACCRLAFAEDNTEMTKRGGVSRACHASKLAW